MAFSRSVARFLFCILAGSATACATGHNPQPIPDLIGAGIGKAIDRIPAPKGKYTEPPIQLDPPMLSFGLATLGETRVWETVLTNIAVHGVTLTGLTVSGFGFSLAKQPTLPLTLLPGESTRFNVRFDAAQPCRCSGKLRVVTDVQSNLTFSLTARVQGTHHN